MLLEGINMKSVKVSNFKELHDALSIYRKSNRWMFRGQANPSWSLLPKVGRKQFKTADDVLMFEAWKRRATEFVNPKPTNDWEWLAIAQHHGLATRLLDWTYQPLTAAFFAVAEKTEIDMDAHLYCFQAGRVRHNLKGSPFKADRIEKYKPAGVAARIIRQGGLFSMHPDPETPLPDLIDEDDELELIVIDKDYCPELIFELNHYGVNNSTVKPDLDGLCSHVNWHSENVNYWLAIDKDVF
jgi:hypothetical protein